MMSRPWIGGLLLPLALAACTLEEGRLRARNAVSEEVERITASQRPIPAIRRLSAAYQGADQVEYKPSSEGVTLDAVRTPVSQAMKAIASPRGYGLVLPADAGEELITVRIQSLPFDLAVREIALAAGLVAVFDNARKVIHLAREASYTWRLPGHLLESTNMDYQVSSAGGSQPGSPMGGMASTGPMGNTGMSGMSPGYSGQPNPGAGFSTSIPATVAGNGMRIQGRSVSALPGILAAVREVAGAGAGVTLVAETGMLTVRGDGPTLKRVGGYVEALVADAARQIELKAALVEVTLRDEMASGIDWSRVLGTTGNTTQLALTTASGIGSPAVSTQVTSASVNSVIRALESRTEVRVVAEPQLWMLNHQPGIVFNATQRPYLGSISTSISGTGALATSAGALSFVMDGVSLAFKPNIIDARHAELTVVPVLATATNQQTFTPGPSMTLVGYDLPTSTSHLKVLLESGRTYLIGGNRFSTRLRQADGIPGTVSYAAGALVGSRDDQREIRELVLMLHASILPAPRLQPLINEGL